MVFESGFTFCFNFYYYYGIDVAYLNSSLCMGTRHPSIMLCAPRVGMSTLRGQDGMSARGIATCHLTVVPCPGGRELRAQDGCRIGIEHQTLLWFFLQKWAQNQME